MVRLLVVLAVVWLALMPPLFTGGACSREFEDEAARLERDRPQLTTPARAASYWGARGVAIEVMSVDQCRHAKPRDLANCGDGPILTARVPVKNTICRIYRDDDIRVRLHFDDHDRLWRIATDMSPYRSLPIPFTGAMLHWAR